MNPEISTTNSAGQQLVRAACRPNVPEPEPTFDLFEFLPAELRVKIIKFVMPSDQIIKPKRKVDKRSRKSFPGLILTVSKWFHKEAAAVLYGSNTFVFDAFSRVMLFMRVIGPNHLTFLTRISLGYNSPNYLGFVPQILSTHCRNLRHITFDATSIDLSPARQENLLGDQIDYFSQIKALKESSPLLGGCMYDLIKHQIVITDKDVVVPQHARKIPLEAIIQDRKARLQVMLTDQAGNLFGLPADA